AAPNLTINAASTSIARGEVAAKAITVNALIANYLKGPAISGTIKADSVTSGKTVVLPEVTLSALIVPDIA
ncbi:MAG: hypothetical protein E5X90_28490, partial [Mesorhizobium sp.]